jgi:hypothetical protein
MWEDFIPLDYLRALKSIKTSLLGDIRQCTDGLNRKKDDMGVPLALHGDWLSQ